MKGRLLLLPVANPRAFAGTAASRRSTSSTSTANSRAISSGDFTQQLARQSGPRLPRQDRRAYRYPLGRRPADRRLYLHLDRREPCRAPSAPRCSIAPAGPRGTMYSGTAKVVTLDKRGIPVVVIELGGGIVDQAPYVKRGRRGRASTCCASSRCSKALPIPPPKQDVMCGHHDRAPDPGGVHRKRWHPPLGERDRHGRAPIVRIVSPYTFEMLEEIHNPAGRRLDGVVAPHAQPRATRNLRIYGRARVRANPGR